MSLWLDSLSSNYHYCTNDEERRKCVVTYLSMPVPRSWWKICMGDTEVIANFAGLIKDLCKDFKATDYFDETDYSLFVALAFIDEERSDDQQEFGMGNNDYSVGQYFEQASSVLLKRPELNKLGKMIAQYERKISEEVG